MPNIVFVDTHEVQQLVDSLREVKRSALPNAVKDTVNNLAFDLKQRQLLPSAADNFTLRAPNFIKANSKVVKATDRNRPIAEAGMLDKGAASDFHEQEVGGKLSHSAIPFDTSRMSNSRARKVAKQYYLSQKAIIDTSKRKRPTAPKRSRMVADAAYAKAHGLRMFTGMTLWEVRTFRRTKSGAPRFKLRALYSIKKGRSVQVPATHFVKEAGEAALEKTESFFKLAAERQITKAFARK